MNRRIAMMGMCVGLWTCAHAGGQQMIVTNLLVNGTLAQGSNSVASGVQAVALGENTMAAGDYSHAEGDSTEAGGIASHAEGAFGLAGGAQSHAEGFATDAGAVNSHAGGSYARVRPQDSNAFIHATGTSVTNCKETLYPDTAHFDHLVTLAPALDVGQAVLSRAENDRRYLVTTNGAMGSELDMDGNSVRNVSQIDWYGDGINIEAHASTSTNVWEGWNADLLDGLDSTDFVRRTGENRMDGSWSMDGNLQVSAPFAALELAAQIPASPYGGNRPQSLYVRGDLAYGANVAEGERFIIYDVSNPAAPVKISQTNLIGEAQGRDLQVEGDYAYVSGGYGFGFVIIDVANPLAPSVVRYTNPIGQFDPKGNLMFTTLSNEMVVFSVTNQMSWTELSRTSVTGAGCVLVEDGIAYVATSSSVILFNVSNPASPTQIGSVSVSNPGKLTLDGTRLYAMSDPWYASELKIVDVSNPAAPTLLPVPGGVGGTYQWMAVEDGYVYIAGDGDTKVYDVREPASPVLLCSTNLTGSVNIGGIFKKGDYLLTYSYFNNKLNSLRIVGEAGQGVVEADAFVGDGSGLSNIQASAIVDGEGSGLDADLLDGQHAAEFVQKSGDAMTGTLAVGCLTNVSAIYMGSDAVIHGCDALMVYDLDGFQSMDMSYRSLNGVWTADTNFVVNGQVAAQLLSGAHAGNGAGLTNLNLAHVAGLATADFVTNAVKKTGDEMTGDLSLAGSLLLQPTLETVLNPGFQTDGDVTIHWMTESGTYFKYGWTGGDGDRFHFGSDGEFKAWGNVCSLADVVADRDLFAARDLAIGGQGRVQYDPEIGTNQYALWVRNFASTADDARGLLVTTPEYNGSEGIIFHAASMAGGSMASRFIVGADGNVGVGVNDPQSRLHVAGDVRVSGNLLMSDGQNVLSPNFNPSTWGSGYDAWGPNAYLKCGFARELLVAQNAEFQGKVKIGTDSDYAQLNVEAPTNLATPTYAARFESALGADSDKARGLLINFPNTTNGNSILFHAMSGAGPYTNSRVVIKADGKVGIGTSQPEATLHVQGSARFDQVVWIQPAGDLSMGIYTNGAPE